MNQWSSYNYQTHVLGGRNYGRVDHFKNYQQMTGTQAQDPLQDFRDKITYAFPNHFPQHSLNALLLKSLREQNNAPIFNHEYVGHQKTQSGVNIQVKDRQNGSQRVIQSRFLVAADGVKSRVRGDLGIRLNGE
jgi:2-polyprenyl-6-methoxyphenol hydroxylase-like FAD-dependent oxidoreductase